MIYLSKYNLEDPLDKNDILTEKKATLVNLQNIKEVLFMFYSFIFQASIYRKQKNEIIAVS